MNVCSRDASTTASAEATTSPDDSSIRCAPSITHTDGFSVTGPAVLRELVDEAGARRRAASRHDPGDVGRGVAEPIEHHHLRRAAPRARTRRPVARRLRRAARPRRATSSSVAAGRPGRAPACSPIAPVATAAHGALVGLLLDEHLDRRRRGTRGDHLVLDLGGELASERGDRTRGRCARARLG